MTKENFINKWASVYNVNDTTNPYFIADLDAVIVTEIAKVQEVKAETALNPIAEAYERGEKIRVKDWFKGSWVKKNSDNSAVDEKGNLWYFQKWSFYTKSEDWEIYTEPTEQPAKPFDKERFEAMFRAVLVGDVYENALKATEEILTELDAYYATKEGGANE